jgi:hypothetical protein
MRSKGGQHGWCRTREGQLEGGVCKAREERRGRDSSRVVCVRRGRDGVGGTACRAREGQRGGGVG